MKLTLDVYAFGMTRKLLATSTYPAVPNGETVVRIELSSEDIARLLEQPWAFIEARVIAP